MTFFHFLSIGTTVLSATPVPGKVWKTKHGLCLLFPDIEEYLVLDKATWNSVLLKPRGKSCCVCNTNSHVQLGFHYNDGEKEKEKQLQQFASLKNKKKKTNETGRSKQAKSVAILACY